MGGAVFDIAVAALAAYASDCSGTVLLKFRSRDRDVADALARAAESRCEFEVWAGGQFPASLELIGESRSVRLDSLRTSDVVLQVNMLASEAADSRFRDSV